uniref:Uncharacterized protein n=1 Tax=Parascaris equorum TaxID=6256 RepID=A0A914RMW5_PAREQ
MTVSQDKAKYGVHLKAEPNFRLLGARLKGDQKKVADYLKNRISEEELTSFVEKGTLNVLGYDLNAEEVTLSYSTSGDSSLGAHFETNSDSQTIVMLDTSEDESLREEGLAREVTNRIQKLRKSVRFLSRFCSFLIACFIVISLIW